MADKTVTIKVDESCEMMEVYVGGKLIDSGNFWDFDAKDLLENVLDELGIENLIDNTWEYED
jgi:hypothetical protein